MFVTIRNNDNTETEYTFEPAQGRALELELFYAEQYRTLKIQGFKIEDNKGTVLSFRGSI